ncbi:hypothetical protein Pyn_33361 [Prunus yedoensis var. nudiflora]|uniref:Secreted protein n=1 Tax=Prunus yedoensis var. nudiflora TaxID=2094558 RepID=A0A315AUC8_PRUYE|nr:hypothetical protein Pyn_33361 [Prunus yedoensis var. nudiflora]
MSMTPFMLILAIWLGLELSLALLSMPFASSSTTRLCLPFCPRSWTCLPIPGRLSGRRPSWRFTAFIRIAVFGFASGLEFPEAAL